MRYSKLITALRTAVENGKDVLDKRQLVMMTCLTHSGFPYSSGVRIGGESFAIDCKAYVDYPQNDLYVKGVHK
jgi:hypothetical protein